MRPPTLTFFGGVDEIGGNKLLLRDTDTKILLDFGMSFGARNCFYSSPFLSPRSPNSLQELGYYPGSRASTDSARKLQTLMRFFSLIATSITLPICHS